MKEPNEELDWALTTVKRFIDSYQQKDCCKCPKFDECEGINKYSNVPFCIIENAFDIIHQEILRIKD